MGMKLQDTQV